MDWPFCGATTRGSRLRGPGVGCAFCWKVFWEFVSLLEFGWKFVKLPHRLPVAGQLAQCLSTLDVQFDGVTDGLIPASALFWVIRGEDCPVAAAADLEVSAEHFEDFALF